MIKTYILFFFNLLTFSLGASTQLSDITDNSSVAFVSFARETLFDFLMYLNPKIPEKYVKEECAEAKEEKDVYRLSEPQAFFAINVVCRRLSSRYFQVYHEGHLDLLSRKLVLKTIMTLPFPYTSVISLNIAKTNLGPEGANILSSSLGKFIGLVKLDLCHNTIGSEGARSLFSELIRLTALKILHLRGNNLCNPGIMSLSTVLGKLTALQDIDLGLNSIDVAGIADLSVVLPQLTALKVLDLTANNIGSYESTSLFTSLLHLTGLKRLHLSRNTLGSTEVRTLSAVLPYLLELETLWLERNNITREDVKPILDLKLVEFDY